MSLLEKCRRDCTGQPRDGSCRAVVPGGPLHFPASQQCSWRGAGILMSMSAMDTATASDSQGALCSPAARQGPFKIPGLVWDCSAPTTPWAGWLLSLAADKLWLKYVSTELWAAQVCGSHRPSHINQFCGEATDPSAFSDHPRGPGHSSQLLQTLGLLPRLQPL